MRRAAVFLTILAAWWTIPTAQSQSTKTLDIYVIDVEGGNAQLWVTPSGESVLIDTGNGGAAAVRDADRIMAAVKDAGVTQIDHLITTHYHGDHVGGLTELATRIPIKEFIDHGPNVQPGAQIDPVLQQYRNAAQGETHRREDRRQDSAQRSGLAHRQRRGTGPQDAAAGRRRRRIRIAPAFKRHDVNPVSGGPSAIPRTNSPSRATLRSENFASCYLGDFDWNQEFELMCPNNRIGTVDLFVASRHGQPSSNSEALVHAVRPRVTIMNNGPRKGGQPAAMNILLNSPGLEDLWQIHFALLGGQDTPCRDLHRQRGGGGPFRSRHCRRRQRGTPAPPAPQHDGTAHLDQGGDGSGGRQTSPWPTAGTTSVRLYQEPECRSLLLGLGTAGVFWFSVRRHRAFSLGNVASDGPNQLVIVQRLAQGDIDIDQLPDRRNTDHGNASELRILGLLVAKLPSIHPRHDENRGGSDWGEARRAGNPGPLRHCRGPPRYSPHLPTHLSTHGASPHRLRR